MTTRSSRTVSARSRKGRAAACAVSLGAALLLGACSGPGAGLGRDVSLDYWLWDANQLPAYQQCIDAFEEQNEDIEVRINQYGWGDYWQKITAGFVAGVGPDVFTNHLTRFPAYGQRDLLLDLDTLEATSNVDTDSYQEGLPELWEGQDGGRYGLPKDFDTIALFYNLGAITEAGLTPDDLAEMTWNPEDGGTFEDVLARLSVDVNGVRGDEEGFDPRRIATYGLASNGSGGADGQTQWSWLAGATGWRFTDADVWGTEYNYDDPRLHETLEWYFGLVEKGFMAPYQEVGGDPNPTQALGSGRAAMSSNGSWMIPSYSNLSGIELGIAPIPSGPVGHPVSMYNGLADSISSQTEHPEEASRLVAFLGSAECQVIVGEAAVVFPANREGTDAAINAFAERGIDVSPFTDLVDEGYTLYFPVTTVQATVQILLEPIMDEIYIGAREPSSLTQVNDRVNGLFE